MKNRFKDSLIAFKHDLESYDIPKKSTFWRRLKLFIIMAAIFVVVRFFNEIYEPSLNASEIPNFHFLEYQQSLFMVPIMYLITLFYLSLTNRSIDIKKSYALILLLVFVNIMIQCFSMLLGGFVYYDVAAIIVSGGIMLLIQRIKIKKM